MADIFGSIYNIKIVKTGQVWTPIQILAQVIQMSQKGLCNYNFGSYLAKLLFEKKTCVILKVLKSQFLVYIFRKIPTEIGLQHGIEFPQLFHVLERSIQNVFSWIFITIFKICGPCSGQHNKNSYFAKLIFLFLNGG